MRKIPSILLSICLVLNGLNAWDMPAGHEQVMKSALLEVFNVTEPESVERLLKGMSSPGLYKIAVGEKFYVVRFCNTRRSFEDKQRELDAMHIASSMGLAPRVIYANLEDGVTIMDYIETTPVNPLSQDSLRLLGSKMRQIHEGPDFRPTVSTFDLAKFFESHLPSGRPAIIKQVSTRLEELRLELKDLLVEKPCHRDLNPNNILYSNGNIYFIDWELAGLGDPFFDLATPVILYSMSQEQEETLLGAYFGRVPSPEERYKLEKMKSVARIYYGFALVLISVQTEAYITDEEIQALPNPNEIVGKGDKAFTRSMQPFGFALLRKALEN